MVVDTAAEDNLVVAHCTAVADNPVTGFPVAETAANSPAAEIGLAD